MNGRSRTAVGTLPFASLIRELRGRTLAGLALAALAPPTLAFALVHPSWSDRAVTANALSDAEQRSLVATLSIGIVAVLAAGALFVARERRAGKTSLGALERFALGGLVAGPLLLYPLYQAHVPEHVLLFVVAAMGAVLAYGVNAWLGDRAVPSAPAAVVRAAPFVVAALALAHAIALSRYSHAVFRGFGNGWDLAVYDQVHANIVDTGIPWSTQYSATESENHYAIHFSPIYHLTALVYALHRSPNTLTSLQNVALAAGAMPLFLLARHKTKSTWVAACLALSYLCNPALQSIGVYEFHEIAFFVPLVLAATWAIETDRPKAFWAFVVLALMVREDTPLYLAFFALYLWSTGRGAVAKPLGAIALGYLVLVHGMFIPALRHIRPFPFYDRFLDLMRGGHKSTGAILSTLATNPLYCIRYVVGSPERLGFVALTWLPVAFLPVRSGRALLLLVPGFFFSLMSSFGLQYSIFAHYTATFMGFLYFAAIIGIATVRPQARIALATAALLCSALLSGKYGRYEWLNPTFVRDKLDFVQRRYGEDATRIHALAASVPRTDSVRATNNLLPALSGRRYAYILPGGAGTDWAFIDYRRDGWHDPATFPQVREILREMLSSTTYGVVYRDARVVVLHKGADPSGNAAALEAIEHAD